MKKLVLCLFVLCAAVSWGTVTTQTYTTSYNCTGGFGPFAFGYPISDPTALTVIQNGVTLATSSYTVTPVNNNYNNGGSVTLGGAFPCTAGYIQILTRVTPITQTIKFYDNMPIPMSTFERGLDKLTEIDQEIWGRTTHSIQMQNNGADYLLPATGDMTFNYINCIVSGPQNDFAITCPTTTGSGSGIGGRYVGWEGIGSTSQLGSLDIIYVGGSTFPCDDVGINAATAAAAVNKGTVDARGCTGMRTTAATIIIPDYVTLLLGPSQWTMNGCPNIDMTGRSATLLGGGAFSTQLRNNTATCDSIHQAGVFQEIGGLDLEVAVGVTRTAGAGINFDEHSHGVGATHTNVHDMLITVGSYGMRMGSRFGGASQIRNIAFSYGGLNYSGLQAWIYGGIALYNITSVVNNGDGTSTYTGVIPYGADPNWVGHFLYVEGFANPLNNGPFHIDSGTSTTMVVENPTSVNQTTTTGTAGIGGECCIASFQFSNIIGNYGPSWAGIVMGSSLDTWEFVNVDIAQSPPNPFTALLMTDTGHTTVPPRWSRFDNFSVEGYGAPAVKIESALDAHFNNSVISSTAGSDHAFVIDPLPNVSIYQVKTVSVMNSKIGGAAKETVYITEDPANDKHASGITFIGNQIGDASTDNDGLYSDMFIAGTLADYSINDNYFHPIFHGGISKASVEIGVGNGTRFMVANNRMADQCSGCPAFINGATGDTQNTFPNQGATYAGNEVRSTQNQKWMIPSLWLQPGSTFSTRYVLQSPAGGTLSYAIDDAQASDTFFRWPVTAAGTNQVPLYTGSATPTWVNGSTTVNGVLCALGGSCTVSSGSLTGLQVANGADTTLTTYLRSGLTADQLTYFAFQDYLGATKWAFLKNASNNFQLLGGGAAFMQFQTTGCCTTFNAQFGTANAFDLNASATASTGGMRIWTGGATPTVATTLAANSSIKQAGVAFASLPSGAAGTFIYCTDCKTTTPATCSTAVPAACACAATGNGAWARYYNFEGAGAGWYCQ